jgi:CubicO group peptidase (beta-lactamase class C family)
MKDTTFFPNAEQMRRIAKTYKPGKDASGAPTLIAAKNPFVTNDPTVRCEPEPSGGLFSTAADMMRFYQMVLNGGELEGKWILSASAVAEMTRPQATVAGDRKYGLGWFVYPDGSFGHGGAFATDGRVDPKRRLVTVFMVQSVLGNVGATKKTFESAVNEAVAGQ